MDTVIESSIETFARIAPKNEAAMNAKALQQQAYQVELTKGGAHSDPPMAAPACTLQSLR